MAIPLPEIFGNTPARITSGFGQRKSPTLGASTHHRGVDIAAKKGTPVRSLAGGKVVSSGYNPKDGYYIKVDHGKGYQSTYGHLNTRALFKAGQEIENGQVIGQVGSTGISTGPHTHVGIKKDGEYINPKSIQDLELLIRPNKTETEPTVQTVSKPLETPTQEVKTTENIENINTMANPNQTAGTYQKEGRGKLYATTGDMASDILGKGIGQVSANEIMTMAMNQGYSRRDAKRAAKGLEKFQQLGGQAEMVFDPNANRYNVLFKNEQGVEVNPAQGRRLGSNVKFGAADLLGLGRDVNTLASVISRQRAVNAQAVPKVPSTESKIAQPTLEQSQPQVETPQIETPQVKTETPGETDVLQEESVVNIPPLLKVPKKIDPASDEYVAKVLNGKYPGQLENTKSQVKSKPKAESNPSDVFQKAAYRGFKEGTMFDERYLKFLQNSYREEQKKFPNLTPEQHLKNVERQATSNAFDIASLIAGGAALKGTQWVAGQAAKKILQTKAGKYVWNAAKGGWQKVGSFFKSTPAPKSTATPKSASPSSVITNAQKALPEAKITRMARERGVVYNPSSGQTMVTPQASQTQAKELLRLSQGQKSVQTQKQILGEPVVKTAAQKRATIARDKYGKSKAAESRATEARKKYEEEQRKKAIDKAAKEMDYESGRFKKGGKLSAVSLMGLPKADDGKKLFTADDLTQSGATKVELEPSILTNSQMLDAVTVTPEFKDRKISDVKLGQITPQKLDLNLSNKIGAPKLPEGVYEKKGDVPPGKKFDWRNTLEGAGIIGGPLLASMQKQPKTKIARPQKLQFRAPVAADLPTPQYMRISSRPENLGSDITEQNRYSNMAEAQNKQIRNQWSAQNAMQKEQTKQRAMEILNQQDVINAQMLGDVNTRQAYLDAQRRQVDFSNKMAAQQAAFGNLADRSRWASADRAQSQRDWASDVIKNPDAYGGSESAEYKKALQTMRTGLGMGKYGMKLKASNLLKKK